MPTDRPLDSGDVEQTWYDLREGLQNSREFVRRSRLLIELSESDRPPVARLDPDGATD